MQVVSGSWWAPLPYVVGGLLPFGVGTLLARVSGYPLRLEVWGAGTVAVAALILGAFAAREAFEQGTGGRPGWGLLSPRQARVLAYCCVALAGLLGLWLKWGRHTGIFTLPLGALGLLGGSFCGPLPLKWRGRGLIEAAGGLCFGFLPVAAGYYLQCGFPVAEVVVYGLLLSCAAFNLFLINGFPYPGVEPAAPPGTLAERWGPAAGALIYTLVNVLLIAGLAFCLLFPAAPLPFPVGFWVLILLALINQELIKRRAYRQEGRLKLLARLTLSQYLALGLVSIISLWQRL